MPYTFLVFDFGTNEEIAQQARHRIEGWRQGFRLDKKLQLKFDREEPEPKTGDPSPPSPKPAKTAAKSKPSPKAKSKSGDKASEDTSPATAPSDIQLIVRLDFSDHEKLSHQRWVERIPAEEPFKTAKPKIVRAGDPEFGATSEKFDSLD